MIQMDSKTFTFVSVLTGLVVVIFVGAATAALFTGKLTFSEYAGSVGSLAGLLIGMWVKSN